MKESKRMEPLIKAAEGLKTDQTIPKKWARKLLTVNRGLIRELRKYDEALETLRGEKDSLKKVKKGEVTLERHFVKLLHAKRQVEEFEFFTQHLSKLLERYEGKRDCSLIS